MDTPNSQLDDLMIAYVDETRVRTSLTAAWKDAYESMPDWAKSGPKYLLGDGSLSNEGCGWPRIEALPEPRGGVVRVLIRPSPMEVWRFKTLMLGSGTYTFERADGTIERTLPSRRYLEYRRKTRLEAFAAVRKVIARIRRQRDERRKAGLIEIGAAQSASGDRLLDLESRIRAVAIGSSPSDLAADALMESCYLGSSRYSIGDQEEAYCWIRQTLLSRLAPYLTGILRVLVDDFVHGDDDRTYENTLIGGGLPPGVNPLDLVARSHVEGIAA